jgi:hypothetical protein
METRFWRGITALYTDVAHCVLLTSNFTFPPVDRGEFSCFDDKPWNTVCAWIMRHIVIVQWSRAPGTQLTLSCVGDRAAQQNQEEGDCNFKYHYMNNKMNDKKHECVLCINSVALVGKRTIPTERLPFVDEVSANFCG